MKKTTILLATLAFAGSAAAAQGFDAKNYVACDAHSLGAVQMAKNAVALGKPVESVLNDVYASPDVLDVKLALLAVDAMKAGLSKPEDAPGLQRFLAGVCYESGLTPKPIATREQKCSLNGVRITGKADIRCAQ